ncbi:hypothetical protein GOBAR_DD18977 [Gossypium barbadense]|nr:hypothetical protein GOBAR_DD18977 [Gossypium barbadense]
MSEGNNQGGSRSGDDGSCRDPGSSNSRPPKTPQTPISDPPMKPSQRGGVMKRIIKDFGKTLSSHS